MINGKAEQRGNENKAGRRRHTLRITDVRVGDKRNSGADRKNGKRKTILFGDRFPFRYLAKEYGLKYYAAFSGCSKDAEASAQTVKFLINKVKKEKLPVVFTIEMSNGKVAKSIVEATGAKQLMLHSLHNLTEDELKAKKTYVDLMKDNIKNLKQALN